MTQYETLLHEGENHKIQITEKDFKSDAKGLIKGNRIAIRKDIPTSIEKACVLAEELGHHYTTVGNILDQTKVMNRKQEYIARLWGYNRLIGLRGIIDAYENKCRDLHDMADYLEVTEEFLQEALTTYRSKYGLYTKIDNYIIYFEPNLGIIKII